MTKQQAREKAEIEFHTTGREIFLDDLAMEIYTEAFTEWSYAGGWFKRVANGKNIWYRSYLKDTKQYNFSDLIQLFEQEN